MLSLRIHISPREVLSYKQIGVSPVITHDNLAGSMCRISKSSPRKCTSFSNAVTYASETTSEVRRVDQTLIMGIYRDCKGKGFWLMAWFAFQVRASRMDPPRSNYYCDPYALNLPGGFSKLGILFGGSKYKDHSILGSILGSLYLGKLPPM